MSLQFHVLKIKEVKNETQDCISVSFDVPTELKDTYRFNQGQNLTLRQIVGGEELRRTYSICTSPNDNVLRVAIKKAFKGKFSNYAVQHFKPGDEIEVLPPTGTFYTQLSSTHKKKYIAFAAGSGITPIISNIKATLESEPLSDFTLIYGNKNRKNIIFFEELEALKNKYLSRFTLIHILSREKTDAEMNFGRIDSTKCNELSRIVNFEKADEIFICGPQEMIFDVKNWLLQNEIDETKIHFELFNTIKNTQPKSEDEKPNTPTSKITLKLDGRSLEFEMPAGSTNSILDAAAEAGIDLPFACKGGVCSTCKSKLIEGEVDMEVNWALEQDEINSGFILTCQAHPKSSRVIIDFDER